jgi:hypothetical protein
VKTLATGKSEDRNEQFETIERLKQSYQATNNRVISMDTKKELIGNLYRDGQLYTQEPIEVSDHDGQRWRVELRFPTGCTT